MLATITAIGFWESTLFSVDGSIGPRTELMPNQAKPQLQLPNLDAAFRQLALDPLHPNYPKPSDLKILRNDTIAALILSQQMQAYHQWDVSFLERGALLVANSNFIDDDVLDFEAIASAVSQLQNAQDASTENKLFGSTISPLLPLRTLTNGAQSFIAQYLGFHGTATTYGSTALASVQALRDACNLLQIAASPAVLVGGCHYANLFSFLNNCLLLPDTTGYAEASAASFLMVTPYDQSAAGKYNLHITQFYHDFAALQGERVDWLFYGGAFTPHQDLELKARCEQLQFQEAFSWFAHTGNLGAAELGMLLAAAANWLQIGQTAVIVLQDAYGVVELFKVQKA
jgi:hypothetical protein